MLREILARFGVKVNTAPLKAANATTTGFVRNLNIVGGLLAGGLVVRGLQRFIGNMIDMGDETAKTARQLGIGARELSAWRFAADRAGVDQQSLTNGFRRLQRNIVEAGEGTLTAVRAFDALNVSFTETATGEPRELLEIIPEMADAFAGMSSATERSARAQQLFGRSGAQLLPFFENGSEGITEMLERFERLGIGLDDDFFGKSEQAQDSLADFDLALSGLKATIATDILPVVSRFAVKAAELIADFNKATKDTELFKAGLIALGAVAAAVGIAMLVAFIKPIAIILLVAAAIFLVVLAVDDFLTFMEGGDSIIGKFFDDVGIGADNARGRFSRMFADQELFWTEELPKFLKEAGSRISEGSKFFVKVWSQAFKAIGEFIDEAVRRISNAASFFTDVWAEAFRVIGRQPSPSAAATPRVRPGGGGAGGGAVASIEQNVSVTIDNRGGGDTRNIERGVRRAVADANRSSVRNAQRALTQVMD